MNKPQTSLHSPAFISHTGFSGKWQHLVILILPWLAVVAAFDWLALAFPTFHGSDETLYHFPVIERFFSELPLPDVRDYASATGPLFHVLFAFAAKLVGLDLQALRLLNVVVTLLAVFVFHSLVLRQTNRNEALLLTLIFGLSPYYFGAGFLVMTDSLAILFALLAVRSLYKAWESPQGGHWVMFCVWVCLAVLTRQLYAWLAVGAVFAMFLRQEPLPQIAGRTAALALAGVPLLALVVIWGGLTPPTFQQHHVASASITPRAGVFGMAVFGLYWLALFPDRFLDSIKRLRQQAYLPLAAIMILTVAVLLLVPTTPQGDDNGILWRLARMTPEIAGSRILFWILFPVGLLFMWNTLRAQDMVSKGTVLLALAFLLCNLPNAKVFEKYYDPLIIALLILIETRAQSSTTLARYSRPLVLLAFIAYPAVSWRFFHSA
jgi:4-amino-4-deoxy-L-arabinose transferase-like glycosyltransferase